MSLGKTADICGWILFLAVLFHLQQNYGTRWHIGPHGMPVVLLTDDGQHYRDGAVADPVTVWLVRNDALEAFCFSALVLIGGLAVVITRQGMRRNLQPANVAWHELAEQRTVEQGGERFIARVVADACRIARRVAGAGKRGL